MGYSLYFSSLYTAPFTELYMCWPIWISYLIFRAVLALPKTARSAQTHKIKVSFELFGTLYMYIFAALSSFFLLLQIQPQKKNPVDKKKVDVMQLASGKGSILQNGLPVNLIFSVKPLVLFAFMLLLVLPSSPVMPAFVNSYSKFCIFIFYFSLGLFRFLYYIHTARLFLWTI